MLRKTPSSSRKSAPRTTAARQTARARARLRTTLAEITAVDDQGRPWVRLDGEVHPASATVAVRPEDVGRRATVLVDDAKPRTPIVTGVVRVQAAAERDEADAQPLFRISAEGGGLSVVASGQITLRCGAASLVLGTDGSVRIKGVNIATTATGQNRIRGASVKIN